MKPQFTILTKAALTVATLLAASTASMPVSAQTWSNPYPQYPSSPGTVSNAPRNVGGGVTYISSRPIGNNIVEMTWEYAGTRYTFRSTVDSFFIQNAVESRQARGGEVAALRIAYDEYKRLGYQPGGQVGGGITYISSRPVANNTVEVTWDYARTRYTYTSRLDSFYIQNTRENREARGGEREALRMAYDEYRRLGYQPGGQPGGQVGGGITYISSRPIANNTVEVVWSYAGTRYTYTSQVDTFYIRNLVEARQARGGEIEALRLAYNEYKRIGGGYGQPGNQVGAFTYVSSRPVANNTVEVTWTHNGNTFTYQSVIDSYFIRNRRESRAVIGGEREMLRLAYNEYRRLGGGYGQPGNTYNRQAEYKQRFERQFLGRATRDVINELRRQRYQPSDNGRGRILFTVEQSYQVVLNYSRRNYTVESVTVNTGNAFVY